MAEIGRDDTEGTEGTGLDVFFEAAREHRLHPSDALMSKVLADGLAQQAGMTRPDARPARRGGVFSGLFSALGGWPAMAGLATAAAAGIWIGVSPATGLSDRVSTALASGADEAYVIDYSRDYAALLFEGEEG